MTLLGATLQVGQETDEIFTCPAEARINPEAG